MFTANECVLRSHVNNWIFIWLKAVNYIPCQVSPACQTVVNLVKTFLTAILWVMRGFYHVAGAGPGPPAVTSNGVVWPALTVIITLSISPSPTCISDCWGWVSSGCKSSRVLTGRRCHPQLQPGGQQASIVPAVWWILSVRYTHQLGITQCIAASYQHICNDVMYVTQIQHI